MKKFLKRTLIIVLALLILCGGYIAYLFVLYHWQNGIYVADKYAEPHLSEQFHYRGKPIAVVDRTPTRFGRPRISNWDRLAYWNAFRKFPTLEYCLKRSGRADLDINQFNWKALRTVTQAQVCLHHVAVYLGQPEKMADWLEANGFEARYREQSGIIGTEVYADWRARNPETSFPFSKLSLWGLSELNPIVIYVGGLKLRFQIRFVQNTSIPNLIDIEIGSLK